MEHFLFVCGTGSALVHCHRPFSNKFQTGANLWACLAFLSGWIFSRIHYLRTFVPVRANFFWGKAFSLLLKIRFCTTFTLTRVTGFSPPLIHKTPVLTQLWCAAHCYQSHFVVHKLSLDHYTPKWSGHKTYMSCIWGEIIIFVLQLDRHGGVFGDILNIVTGFPHLYVLLEANGQYLRHPAFFFLIIPASTRNQMMGLTRQFCVF